ncbi:hypothetical protein L1987_38211 [Smallanthus sonchifolius]|uniref:Uncharacterized protein n=1 Tax=Smallanthus sonchifolius TaxID=185202 RepID=A0ACB9HJT1_9ASTR|nr:hypothetical protein L1987_38211 [Smallanthus sonchifolius]
MAYAGVQMLMEKLKQLINRNHIPSINYPSIIYERPQFQHLYDELDNPMIQTLFIDQHQGLERVNDLKKRFIYAAEEAQYIVDLFVSGVHIRNMGHFPTSEDFKSSLNLDHVWSSFESVKVELMSMNIDNIKMDSSRRTPDLVNLRHLRILRPFFLPSIENPMNLQTISSVELSDGLDKFQKCFPYIKELKCETYEDEEYDFKSLTYLEKLDVSVKSTMHDVLKGYGKNQITFPATLKTLTLKGCRLPWSDMSIIQSLPNLQVLELQAMAFEGSCWNTDGQEFPQLKFLRLWGLDIKHWEAYGTSFPCLRQLEIIYCADLEEIPLEIGEIPTFELIQITGCRHTVGDSVRRIQEEQNDFGNYDLKIHISEELPASLIERLKNQ